MMMYKCKSAKNGRLPFIPFGLIAVMMVMMLKLAMGFRLFIFFSVEIQISYILYIHIITSHIKIYSQANFIEKLFEQYRKNKTNNREKKPEEVEDK